MLCYAAVCSLWIPLLAWMMPSHSFRVGMMYLRRSDWTFEVRLRTGELLLFARSSMTPQAAQAHSLAVDRAPMPFHLQSLRGSIVERRPSKTLLLRRPCTWPAARGGSASCSGQGLHACLVHR